MPPVGGAERWMLELLEPLTRRHRVRAVWLGDSATAPGWLQPLAVPPPPETHAYWADKRTRREAVGSAVAAALGAARADVVVTQLHAAPAVVVAARAAGAPTILALPSYESLCKHAFDAGARCVPSSRCRDCPAAHALVPGERRELGRSRDAHEAALATATTLLALTRSGATICEQWCGRPAAVIPGSVVAPPPARADRDGPVVAIARWSRNKGADLLEPIARALHGRALRVTAQGLPDRLAALPNVEVVPPGPLPKLLDGAAVAIVPSQWEEPWGRTAFEAMGAGVPALASGVGGLAAFVPPDQLVRPHADPAAWVDAIEDVLRPDRWQAARAGGLSAVRQVLREDPAARFEELVLRVAS